MLLYPLRLVLALVVNVLLLPRNLLRALRRRPHWIRLRLDGAIAERPARRRFGFRRARALTVAMLDELGKRIVTDRGLRGILLEIDAAHLGWARLETVRGQIAGWRAAGKRVVAHLSSPGNREYFLAAACDEVLADESGPIGLVGLAAENGFYGEALRRLGVDAELDRIGEYKSYAETFTRADMSPAHREATEAILDGIAKRLTHAVAAARKLDVDAARALIDGGPYLAEVARAAGLLDGVLYRDQLPDHLETTRDRMAAHDEYLKQWPRWWLPHPRRRRVLAVVSLEGTIVPGEGSDLVMKSCGADSACRALEAARESGRVAGVLLHVSSRGGSAAASDRIWREVERLGKTKPVVAYLDDVAASGGYYVVAPADWIVAQSTVLTGSIGVVAGKFSVERLLERLGVGTAQITRGRVAGMDSPRRRYDEEERARLRRQIDGLYRQFVAKVARGRKLDEAVVDGVARGRVWTGEDAVTRKLVDQEGCLADAVAVLTERVRARGRARERFDVHDLPLKPRREGGGLLGLLGIAGAQPASLVEEALCPWRSLACEHAFLVAADLPDVR